MPRLRVLPGEIRSTLPLEKGERVLASARTADGAYLVASTLALYLPAGGESEHERLGWESIEHAEWDKEDERLRITPIAPFGERIEHRTFGLSDESDANHWQIDRLLTVVRERITASVVIDRRVPIDQEHAVRVVARRKPVPDAELTWMVELDPGLSASDPQVVDAANQALAQVRSEIAM